MSDEHLSESDTDIKCCKRLLIKASIPISIAFALLIMILFIVSIVIENPSFKDYDIIPLISISFSFTSLLSYGIIALDISGNDELSTKGMLLLSLGIGILHIILCILSLAQFHSYILSTLILAFGLVASLTILILNLLFYLYHKKKGNSNCVYLSKEPKQESTETKKSTREYQSERDDLLINISDHSEHNSKSLNPNDVKSKNNPTTRLSKGEIGKNQKLNLINEEEIKECIIRELPAMHNPEIMKHMKPVEGQKVVWNKTHFIIALESGGNS